MKRISAILIILMAVSLVGAHAQPAGAVLVLSLNSPEYKAVAAGFKGAYGADFREINLEGSDQKQRKIGEELKASKPAIVVAVGDLAVQMAKWYLEGLPTVYCYSEQAQKISLTGAKVVGIYHEPDPMEQLKTIQALFSGKNKIGLLYNPDLSKINEEEIKKRSQSLGLAIEAAPLNSVKAVPDKLRTLIPRVNLIWIVSDPVVFSRHSGEYIVLQTLSAGVPIFCGNDGMAHSGATAALIPDPDDIGKKAAAQAKLLMKGSAPLKGGIIYPKGKLMLNQKMATLFKVSFPPAMVSQAAEVIQ